MYPGEWVATLVLLAIVTGLAFGDRVFRRNHEGIPHTINLHNYERGDKG